VRLWRSAGRPADAARQHAPAANLASSFGHGVLISITNPTAVAYYAGVFSALLRPNDPAWLLAAAVFLIAFNSVVWNTALSFVFSTERAQSLYERWDKPITLAAAIFMVAFCIKVAISAS
jgi:threonine/homoserine/homoserine lactone efflux protein